MCSKGYLTGRAGNLTNVDYNVSTDLRFKYDALYRVTNMVDAAGTTAYSPAYTAGGSLQSEDGPWASDTVGYTYHATVHGLRTGLSIQQPTASFAVTNAYDGAKRLTNVATAAGSHGYLYAGGTTYASHLIRRLTHPNTSYITNDYDSVARLLFTKLNNSSHTTLNSHSYTYNVGNQRTRQTRRDSSYVDYTYDSVGQLTRALGSGGYSTENLGYGYDVAWNLSVRTNNGTPTTFSVNVLDQLTAGPAPSYTYDWNGNLTSEQSARTFTYDDENQLVSVSQGTYYRTDFVYDGRQRLRKLQELIYGQYGWQVNSETRFVYDGMLIVQERSWSNVPTVTYTRGTDLSGTFEGAGGIGGLLTRSDQLLQYRALQ
jgi:hypothetical protein